MDPYFIFLEENELSNQVLTLREIDILRLINLNLNNSEISKKLYISKNTVKYHVRNIYVKTGLKNREDLKIKTLSTLQRKRVTA